MSQLIGIDDLIASKRTGRLQDAADIEVLEEIKRARELSSQPRRRVTAGASPRHLPSSPSSPPSAPSLPLPFAQEPPWV